MKFGGKRHMIERIELRNREKNQNIQRKRNLQIRANKVVIYEVLCFDVAQGQMNGAPNETRTHS